MGDPRRFEPAARDPLTAANVVNTRCVTRGMILRAVGQVLGDSARVRIGGTGRSLVLTLTLSRGQRASELVADVLARALPWDAEADIRCEAEPIGWTGRDAWGWLWLEGRWQRTYFVRVAGPDGEAGWGVGEDYWVRPTSLCVAPLGEDDREPPTWQPPADDVWCRWSGGLERL
jgi:hypothetical protein